MASIDGRARILPVHLENRRLPNPYLSPNTLFDEALARVVVRRALLAAGAGLAATGADPDVVLVEVAAARGHATVLPSIESQSATNSGSVFAVVPMSTTSTPGTTRPSTAPAVAIRWSS